MVLIYIKLKNSLNLKLWTPAVRNVMDMNAFFGGFAAALSSDPVWVMNVVPVCKPSTLGIIYDVLLDIVMIGRDIFAIDESSATDGKILWKSYENNRFSLYFIASLMGLVPLSGSTNKSWCQGLDSLTSRSAEYYKQGARFAKWRTAVCIPCGPSALAINEAVWGLIHAAILTEVR